VSDAPPPDAEDRWQRANLALACFALDPSALGGIWLRARVGPVRDRFLRGFDLAVRGKTVSRLHPDIGDDALFGGIDLAATLGAGTVTRTLAFCTAPVSWSCRWQSAPSHASPPGSPARWTTRRACRLSRSTKARGPRNASPRRWPTGSRSISICPISRFRMRPTSQIDTDAMVEARRILPASPCPTAPISDLAQVAFRLGITSLRAPLQALALARASAALSGETEVGEPDLLTAVELVLAPRATQSPKPGRGSRRSPTRRRTISPG
jgi:magnesium chelatase subunit D